MDDDTPVGPPRPIDAKWIDDVMDRFEDASLPPSELSHGVHLLIALVYARQYAPDPAQLFRLALHRYLEKRAGDTRAYHETITLAWLRLVVAFSRTHDTLDLPTAAAHLLTLYPDKFALAAHYSRALLMSDEARAAWVEPDLAPLP